MWVAHKIPLIDIKLGPLQNSVLISTNRGRLKYDHDTTLKFRFKTWALLTEEAYLLNV